MHPRWLGVLNRVWPRPRGPLVFLLGNQKSGTTAIAALLAECTGLACTLDMRAFTVEEQDRLASGSLAFESFVRSHAFEFSRPLVKEPALTFLADELRAAFPASRFVFILRDPRENIRSILNRLKLSGIPDRPEPSGPVPEGWRRVLDNRWLGIPSDHYIESMAERWNLALRAYESAPEETVLVRYEDFLADKLTSIRDLALRLGLAPRRDIRSKLDTQFQPRGDRDARPVDFFGPANLDRIERICAPGMARYGYGPAER